MFGADIVGVFHATGRKSALGRSGRYHQSSGRDVLHCSAIRQGACFSRANAFGFRDRQAVRGWTACGRLIWRGQCSRHFCAPNLKKPPLTGAEAVHKLLANVRQKINRFVTGANDASGSMLSCDCCNGASHHDGGVAVEASKDDPSHRRTGPAEIPAPTMTVILPRDTSISPFLLPELGAAWEQIRKLGVERDFSPGEYLYRAGDLPTSLHNLLSGRVRVFLGRPDGSERIIAFAERQTTFGEYGIFDSRPRFTSAVAIEPCRVLVVDRAALIAAGKTDPDIFLEIGRRLAQKSRLVTMHLVADGVPARVRVAMILTHLLDAYGMVESDNTAHLSESHRVDDLAQLIGVTRVTMSRELSRLVADKVVAKGGRKIVILNVTALRAIAEDYFF
jgi:CRP/FNR family cyclic AMP-dependent transcriptional regulator